MKGTGQFDVYAAFYDLLYKDKDYRGEALYIDQLITQFSNGDKAQMPLLDLACGTGKHLLELSDLGYSKLSGSDISASMIEVAKQNAALRKKPLSFYNYSFQQADQIDKKFDVVISMFSAFNYITSYEDQSKTLKNICQLLNKNGLLVFDYWNGAAVVRHYSPVKVLRKKIAEKEILRISETTLDQMLQKATVKFTCSYFEANQRMAEFEEVHQLHYYYFAEMTNLLKGHGFEVLSAMPFMSTDDRVKTDDWNISIVARKIS